MGVRELRERMDEARQAYEQAVAGRKELEAGGVAAGSQYDEAAEAERQAREAVAEAEASYEELSSKVARLRKRALVYQRRVAPDGVYQQAVAGAVDDDVKERLEELRALEEKRQRAALEEAAELR